MGHNALMLAGFRAGEACKSGESHGLTARGLTWRWLKSSALDDNFMAKVFAMDLAIQDYKLHNTRGVVSVQSPTASGWNIVDAATKIAEAWNMKIVHDQLQGGEVVSTIDYYVLRLELRAVRRDSTFCEKIFDALISAMRVLGIHPSDIEYTSSRGKSRAACKQKKLKYINFHGGTRRKMAEALEVTRQVMDAKLGACPHLTVAQKRAVASGEGWISMVEGPLLRSTQGGRPTHMPISYNTFASDIVGYWKNFELKEMGGASMRLSTHSGRRGSVKHVRLLLARMPELAAKLTDEIVDQHYRWLPSEGRMRKHYTGHLDLELRLLVTRYI
jgi:hypothetical protein